MLRRLIFGPGAGISDNGHEPRDTSNRSAFGLRTKGLQHVFVGNLLAKRVWSGGRPELLMIERPTRKHERRDGSEGSRHGSKPCK